MTMQVRVEFYGVARHHAQRSELAIELPGPSATIAQVLAAAAQLAPEFGSAGLADGRLRPELALNLDGERFVSDPAARVGDGQCLLILSADAGG